ncbi:MAG: hypothetical protein KatS3mg023_3934 [Armatimonadota bacterium]|nr:MAG: hypothetical protein KatS3mg023_3934 [Armatimonadota bacterium]
MKFYAIRCQSDSDTVTLLLDKHDLFMLDKETVGGLVVRDYQIEQTVEELDWCKYLQIIKDKEVSVVAVERYSFCYRGKWYSVPIDAVQDIIRQISGRIYRYGTLTITEQQLQRIIQVLESLEYELVPNTLDRSVDYFFKIPVGEYELYVFREDGAWALLRDGNAASPQDRR